MNKNEVERFFAKLCERAIEIAPDYPGIAEVDPWEHLWAITASYEGTNKANQDLHKVCTHMRKLLGWSAEEFVERAEQLLKEAVAD